jgi:Icc-related predicted phosphoesterase
MPLDATPPPPEPSPPAETRIRVAAAGDVHCNEANRDQTAAAFAEIDGTVDLIVLAGDLTTHGEPEQGAVLADACRGLATPVFAVMGNHDWHVNRRDELVAALEDGGITMLDPGSTVCRVRETEVGIVGAKGFIGGFPGCYLPDFGEPSLRAVYAEAGRDVEAVEQGLAAVAHCPFQIVVLHYAPITETLEGEPREIWAFLGTDRLARPLLEHQPDLVVHGHAHAGTFAAELGDVPVFNVSVPVMRRDFSVFELSPSERLTGAVH